MTRAETLSACLSAVLALSLGIMPAAAQRGMHVGGGGFRGGSGGIGKASRSPGRFAGGSLGAGFRVQPQPGLQAGFYAQSGRHGFFTSRSFFVGGRRLIFDPAAGTPLVPSQPLAQCPPFRLAGHPQQPPALLVFQNGSMYEIQDFLIEAGCIHYRTTYGGNNTVPLAALALEETRKKNTERNVTFEVPNEGLTVKDK